MLDCQGRIVTAQTLTHKLSMTAIRLALETQQCNPLVPDAAPQLTERGLGLWCMQQSPKPRPAARVTLAVRLSVVPRIPQSGQMHVLNTSRRKGTSKLSLG